MAANNSFHILGNVGKDPNMQYLPNEKGTAMVSFSVAVTEGFGDKKKTHWFNCTMFGKRAEAFNEYVHAGRAVSLEGTLSTYERTLENGSKVTAFNLKVSDWAFAGSEANGNGGGRSRQNSSRGGGWNQQGSGNRNNGGGNQRGNWNRNGGNQQGGGYPRGGQAPVAQEAPMDYEEADAWEPPF
jgi:single-strand DNA-binding protein